MNVSDCVKIGYIVKTHGLKGEVTLSLSPDYDLSTGDVLFVETQFGLAPYFVERISYTGKKVYARLSGVESVEVASELTGGSVYIEKSKRPKLDKGEYYDDELVGLQVWDGKKDLGPVIQVINQTTLRYLEVGDEKILIPINGPFIKSISKGKKRIEVELPEGFLDI